MNALREAKSLARQGLPHPDPAVRAELVAWQRRWYGLAWPPTIAGCLFILASPVFYGLAWTTGGWRWLAVTLLTVIIAVVPMALAFGFWLTGLGSGWLVAPNLPDSPPARLPLHVPSRVPRSPLAAVVLLLPLMIAEWIAVAITVEPAPARFGAIAALPAFGVPIAYLVYGIVRLRLLDSPVIIEAKGVRLPLMRVALTWEQVAEIRASHLQVAGLAIRPRQPVRLPWWMRLLPSRSPWLTVPDAMMAIAVETVVSTAIHARDARLQLVGEVDSAGRTGANA